jgi:hypothetical protein
LVAIKTPAVRSVWQRFLQQSVFVASPFKNVLASFFTPWQETRMLAHLQDPAIH